MNLADAIRNAGGFAGAKISEISVNAKTEKAATPAVEEEYLAEEAEEMEAREQFRLPEPPMVNSGNVVRLELFLSGEQMQAILRALMAGQHSVLTLREAASYLRISPNNLMDLAEQGEIPGIYLDNKWRFPKINLDEWMAATAVSRRASQLEDAENVA